MVSAGKPLFPGSKAKGFDLARDAKLIAKHYPWNTIAGNLPIIGTLATIPQMWELKNEAEKVESLQANVVAMAVRNAKEMYARGEWQPVQRSFGGVVSPALHEAQTQSALSHTPLTSRMPSLRTLSVLRRGTIAATKGTPTTTGRLRLQVLPQRKAFTPVHENSRPLFARN